MLGTHYGEREALWVSVDRRADVQATWLQKVMAGCQIRLRIRDVLDHFHVENNIELHARSRKILGGSCLVVNFESRFLRMDACDGDIGLRRIDTNDPRSKSRHRLTEQSAAAADVQNCQPIKGRWLGEVSVEFCGDLPGDIVQPDGVHHVERLEFAGFVPPFRRHGLELGYLMAVDRVDGFSHFRRFRAWFPRFRDYIDQGMDKVLNQKSAASHLHPPVDPFDQQMLEVGDGHRIYVEQCGNPHGIPVVVLHGGPGGGCSPAMRRYFDPATYRIVLFDQRGCGRSRPHASIENNTTWHLVSDIELIRASLGIERWILFGGSWGATLALIYAQEHPDRVRAMALRGVFLMTRRELDWFYGGGASAFWPDLWERFTSIIPEDERGDLIGAYHRRLFSGDVSQEVRFARAWTAWENALAAMDSDGVTGESPPDYARAFARLENHYFQNMGFLGEDKQILNRLDLIAHIPAVIVQGRFDMICPPTSAFQLAKRWPKAKLMMVGRAGHALSEPGISAELVRAMERFRS